VTVVHDTKSVRSERPVSSEHAPHQAAYIALVPGGDIVATLRDNGDAVDAAFGSVDETRADYRYGDGKWSLRDVLGHLIDADRILAYRALRLARGDATPLPGYDGDAYVASASLAGRSLTDLRGEWTAVRDGTIRLFASLPDETWARTGTIDGRTMSVRAIAYVTVGHAIHHLRGLARDYGVASAPDNAGP
jgi:uncharacterized damage-inducible protein DinB